MKSFITAGKPTLGLVLSISAGIANIAFDYIFIVLMQMGIKGAALGTGIYYRSPFNTAKILGGTGVWLAIPIAELLTFILTICLIIRHRKHYNYL